MKTVGAGGPDRSGPNQARRGCPRFLVRRGGGARAESLIFFPNPLQSGVISRSMRGERIRCQQTGEFHFLIFSCYRRRAYLSAAADLFEDALERVSCSYLFAVASTSPAPSTG